MLAVVLLSNACITPQTGRGGNQAGARFIERDGPAQIVRETLISITKFGGDRHGMLLFEN